jgi:hypothetical protein
MSKDKLDVCKQISPNTLVYEEYRAYTYSTHREMYYLNILIQLSPFKGEVHRNRLYILLAQKQKPAGRQSSEEKYLDRRVGGDKKLENKT